MPEHTETATILPQVTKRGIFSVQVCIPAYYTDRQVKDFAELQYPCGTRNGWSIRRAGDPLLAGDAERVACEERAGCVHVMLDA